MKIVQEYEKIKVAQKVQILKKLCSRHNCASHWIVS